MKRRVISFITVLAMCLSLCPTRAQAAGREPDAGLCPHHRVHTEECGYVPPMPGRDCTHEHDESCFIAETLCVHQHTEDCYPEAELSLCAHECSEDSGCIIWTPDCPHVHDEFCGYAPEDVGAPCMFTCRLCPIEALMDKLPGIVTPDNRLQVEDQLDAILALYTELTVGEQDQLDLSRCIALQSQLDAANAPMLLNDDIPDYKDSYHELIENKKFVSVFTVEGKSLLYDIHEYTYTATNTSAFLVKSTGELRLTGSGRIISENGFGVEVMSGGKLCIEDPNLTITGSEYALDIASGATVQLSGGTYTGNTAAIQVADDMFGSLLKEGYKFFDASGHEIEIEDMATAKTVIVQAQPTVSWASKTHQVDYDYGRPVNPKDEGWPQVTIVDPTGNPESLDAYLIYYYKTSGSDEAYTTTPPTDAGVYEVKVVLPAMGSYQADEDTLELTINKKKIDASITQPKAIALTYNGSSQELVEAGVIGEAGAVNEGAVIKYAAKQGGPYSEKIPTGVNAYEEYHVWYKVEETKNYDGVSEREITGVDIAPKPITPKIDVSETSFRYDELRKKITITVRDGDTVIPDSQYTISWTRDGAAATELRDAGTYEATIENVPDKNNYTFTAKSEEVEIVKAWQDQLRIEGAPDSINYGDTVTMYTSGGAPEGTVTWTVNPSDLADINSNGKLTTKGAGTVTVTAVRTADNYKDATANWTIKINPKPVTAVVTVESKEYDGNTDVASGKINVTINGLVDTDNLTVSNLKGFYNDPNVGTNKPVTLDASAVTVGGTGAGKYIISYPASATGDITKKTVTAEVTLSGDGLQGTVGSYYYNYDEKEKTPTVTVTYTEDGKTFPILSGNYTVTYSNNTNVGKDATVTVKANPDGNYIFKDGPVKVTFEIKKSSSAKLTSTPRAKDLTYTREPQDLVTVGTATGGKVVYCATEDGKYTEKIPQKTDAGTYIVYYKVEGDSNHLDSDISQVSVTIKPKEITPKIDWADLVDLGPFEYNGSAHEPRVTIQDGTVKIDEINENGVREFEVSYLDNTDAGTATVVISNANGGNYIVNGRKTFTIEKAEPKAEPPKWKTGDGSLPYNATAQELITRGSSPDGTMVYSLDGKNFSEDVPLGTKVGKYEISYKVLGDKNHKDVSVKTHRRSERTAGGSAEAMLRSRGEYSFSLNAGIRGKK